MKQRACRRGILSASLMLTSLAALYAAPAYAARDAAFIDPGPSGSGPAVQDAIRVEPKSDVDAGETEVAVAKRVTLFFVNTTAVPIHVDKITLNNDGNVAAEVSNDDCSKQDSLISQSRCSVEISVTPTSPGPWNVEVLMMHNGPGRIARAKLSGKTSGQTDQKKDNGLTLATKDAGTINFGDVDIDGGKVVRSALMTNDSPDPLSIYSIDVIAAENGLTRLDQGCAVDMELKPGESCPVTLMWTPVTHGQISTDLIIRHSGRMGFAVIPIRGTAHGADAGKTASKSDKSDATRLTDSTSVPPPPSAMDLAKAVKDVPAVSAEALSAPVTPVVNKTLRLIGTVGNRAVLIKSDGTTTVVNAGDTVDMGDREIKITAVNPKTVDIVDNGKKKILTLEAAQELVAKAASRVSSSTDMSGSGASGLGLGLGASGNPAPGGNASAAAPPPTHMNGVTR